MSEAAQPIQPLGAQTTPEAPPVLGSGATPAAAPATTLPDLNAETWRLHVAGGDAELAKRFDRFTDPSALGKSLVEMEKRWSDGRVVRLPQPLPDNATDEQKAAHAREVAEWNAKRGVPKEPKEYQFTTPEGFKPHAEYEATTERLRALGVEAGLDPVQAQQAHDALLAWQTETDAAFEQEAAKAEHAALDALRAQWGGDFDKNWKGAEAAAARFLGSAEAAETILGMRMADGTRLGLNPAIIQHFASLAREFANDPVFNQITGGGANLDGVQARINEINGYRDGTRAGNTKYDQHVDELKGLIEQKNRFLAADRKR